MTVSRNESNSKNIMKKTKDIRERSTVVTCEDSKYKVKLVPSESDSSTSYKPLEEMDGEDTTDLSESKYKLVVFIVFFANFLDWCLISVLNPAAPGYLGFSRDSESQPLSRIGLVISANAGVQLLANLVMGRVIDRVGAPIIFLLGMIMMLFSTLLLALAGDIWWERRYEMVLAARMLQGFSSGCASTAGMAWLCSSFSSSKRSDAIGVAITGTGLGVVVGMPLGSAFAPLGVVNGWRVPFLILDTCLLINIGLFVYSLGSKLPKFENNDDGLGWKVILDLAFDPYVFLIFFLSLLLNVCISSVEASLPSWMSSALHAPNWSLGVIFVACHIPYTVLAVACNRLFARIGRHWALFFGNLVAGIGMFVAPFIVFYARKQKVPTGLLALALALIGSGMGMFDAASMPFAADVVEKSLVSMSCVFLLRLYAWSRHANIMGSACAVINASWSLGFFLGPLGVNMLIDNFGYSLVYMVFGLVLFFSSFLCWFLRKIPHNKLL